MAVLDGGPRGRDDDELTDLQVSLLEGALRPLPRSLADDRAHEDRLIQQTLDDGSELYERVGREWFAYTEAARIQRAAQRTIRGVARPVVERLSSIQPGASIAALGAVLLGVALLPATAAAVDAGLLLIAGGLSCQIAPGLLVMVLRLLRLRRGIDLRRIQARINAISRQAARLGRRALAVGVLLLASPSDLAQSLAFLRIAVGAVLTGAALLLVAGLLRLLFGSTVSLSLDAATHRLETARQVLLDRLRVEGQMGIRERLNADNARFYETQLSFRDHSGLGEIDDPRREIPTAARGELLRRIARMPGGTIGIAGARGAGKTTLMRAVFSSPSTRAKDESPLGVMVDAPVRYESRDFILYLFSRVCGEVVGSERVRQMRGSDRPFGFPGSGAGRLVGSGRWAFGLSCLAGGLILLFLALMGVDDLSSPLAAGAMLLFVGWLAIAVQLLAEGGQRKRLLGTELAPGSEADRAILELAMLRLRQIWFQQSFSTGWSGSFQSPVGMESGWTRSADLAEHQLSLPDIVSLFREFLVELTLRREVRIGIDELDKMDDDTARRFLNEIKVIFRIPDCFFLISISEDAMSFFERRGLPIRDVFDSSFDDIQYVPHLRFADSQHLLERRIVELPAPFACLLHCLSGGLPRDLVRAARQLVAVKPGTPLADAAQQLLGSSLEAKIGAAKVAARSLEYGEHVTVLIAWLDRLLTSEMSPPVLLETCETFEAEVLRELRELTDEPGLDPEARRLRTLAVQVITFVYYAATALQFFEGFGDRRYLDRAMRTPPGGGVAPVDSLAAVTQTFAIDINSSWRMISRFRTTLGLGPALTFPRLRGPGSVLAGE